MVNYGGPGESGVDYLRLTWGRLPAVVQARFDVVSFDPRGTGASRPIDCVDDAFLDLSRRRRRDPDTPERLDTLHRYNAQFAAGCAERMGAYAGQVGTRNVARDLEAIRLALGEPKLDYLGYSYGTIVGITYAQMFPTHHPQHGARRPTRLLARRARLRVPAGARVHGRTRRVPRLVPADELLAGRRPAHRVTR